MSAKTRGQGAAIFFAVLLNYLPLARELFHSSSSFLFDELYLAVLLSMSAVYILRLVQIFHSFGGVVEDPGNVPGPRAVLTRFFPDLLSPSEFRREDLPTPYR